MKDYKCAHCAHCNEIKYDGFFCDKTGYVEDKLIEDDCPDFEADTIDQIAKMVTEKLIAAYHKGAEFTAVRHGQWICDQNGIILCSVCRYPRQIGAKDFCGKCGADMREVGADNG